MKILITLFLLLASTTGFAETNQERLARVATSTVYFTGPNLYEVILQEQNMTETSILVNADDVYDALNKGMLKITNANDLALRIYNIAVDGSASLAWDFANLDYIIGGKYF